MNQRSSIRLRTTIGVSFARIARSKPNGTYFSRYHSVHNKRKLICIRARSLAHSFEPGVHFVNIIRNFDPCISEFRNPFFWAFVVLIFFFLREWHEQRPIIFLLVRCDISDPSFSLYHGGRNRRMRNEGSHSDLSFISVAWWRQFNMSALLWISLENLYRSYKHIRVRRQWAFYAGRINVWHTHARARARARAYMCDIRII